jgi:hypothetical protein
MYKSRSGSIWLSVVLILDVLGMNGVFAQGLGKFSDWSEPINLGPVVNSESDDSTPAISPDGFSLYFRSNRPGGVGGDDIWVSRRASLEEPWQEPQNLGPPINTPYFEGGPVLSRDGHWLYFSSDRPEGCGLEDIWVSWRQDPKDDFAWEPPVNLGCILNSAGSDASPGIFEDEKTGSTFLYIDSDRPGGIGQNDIYMSQRRGDGSFGRPALVWELSSPSRDAGAEIRRDGLEMFLQSDRPGGFGQRDLWVSTRETTVDAWSRPVNVGPIVNTENDERSPALSFDGTTLYFDSDRPGGVGGRDLYATTRKRVHK